MENKNDCEIIHNFINGDTKSFEFLIHKYQNYVYSIAIRLVGNREDARDLVQEIFIKVYQLLPRYSLKYEFKNYLYKISVNYTIDFLRRTKIKSFDIISYDYHNETIEKSEKDHTELSQSGK